MYAFANRTSDISYRQRLWSLFTFRYTHLHGEAEIHLCLDVQVTYGYNIIVFLF